MKGFALFLSLMFVLILTLLGFCLLIMASQHYAVTHDLFEKENSRLACESGVRHVVDRHNLAGENPRFFFDPLNWQGTSLKPFGGSGGYVISANADQAWSLTAANLFQFTARKAAFVSRQNVEIRQLRLEDFAFYCEDLQTLPLSSLFSGCVFAKNGLQLLRSGVRFRDAVYTDVQPTFFASFKHSNSQRFDFPALSSNVSAAAFRQWTSQEGILISGAHPAFWKGDHYELDLDRLQLDKQGTRWSISYNAAVIGVSKQPLLCFDGKLSISQSDVTSSNTLVIKPRVPLYVGAAGDLEIFSNLAPLEDSAFIHPIALVSGGAISIASAAPAACRIHAMLVALGSRDVAGLPASMVIESAGRPITPAEKQEWLYQIAHSPFLVEEEKRTSLLQSLESGEKIAWFEGPVICNKPLSISPDLKQLHFQSSSDSFVLFPSLPFVIVVEGSRQWL